MRITNYVKLTAVSLALGLGLVLGLPATVDAAKLYKWVDEDGNIRYSDRLPANQAKKKHQQLNRQGVIVSTTEDARSDEEIAAEAEAQLRAEQEAAEAARLKAIQDQKDQVLLLTFSSEEELLLSREKRIGDIDSVIGLINKSIVSTQEKLDMLERNANNIYISQGKEVPGGLAQKIEQFTRKIENRNRQLEQKEAEKAKIDQQFEIDLARYRHLKAQE
ncbi:MAG: DUF4124 domain-containing protein [Gammaproteobacteria bacterium]|nr:DUF4124 domain-containing protein [Gammaproteobacteria bacterium]